MSKVSASQKAAARKWDKENLRSVSCRLRTEDAELFKEFCATRGTTAGALIKQFILLTLEKYKEEL